MLLRSSDGAEAELTVVGYEFPDVGALEVLLNVARALGAMDRLVEALDPMTTDLGRARAAQALPKRVRH